MNSIIVLLNKELAKAIIEMENIGYSEGLGPKTDDQYGLWKNLVATAELLAGKKATSHGTRCRPEKDKTWEDLREEQSKLRSILESNWC